MFKEYDVEKLTNCFGRYQWFQLIVIWWCQITIACNVVFMVFGGAVSELSLNDTSTASFYSFVPEWNLQGGLDGVPTLMTSIQLAGALVGALVGGHIADSYGRKVNTWMFFVFTMVLVALSTLSANWQIMTAFRFFIGLTTGGYDSSAIILMMEWVNIKTRLKVQVSLDCVYSVAFCWFAFLAWLCQDWKTLSLVCSLQMVPGTLAFIWIMETPRWCLLHCKSNMLNNLLKNLEVWNRKTYSLDNFQIRNNSTSYLSPCGQQEKKATYLDLFKTKKLIANSCVVMYSMFVTGSAGYMIIFNVGNLVGNIFLNFALLGAVNTLSAFVILFLEHVFHFGRRTLHQLCLNGVWICLSVIVVLYLTGADVVYGQILVACSLLGSMFSFPLWPICNLYSGELFPTNVRNMASGIASMAARGGGILAPVIVYSMNIWNPLPFLIVGAFCLCNVAMACVMLPETRNAVLPEHGSHLEQKN